ncbi:MAG: heme biosynthesis HemY N-terminal domain-containing protein [Stappiaceae bacterium]
MIRVFIFFALALAGALGAAWLADRPGSVTVDWQGYYAEIGVGPALIALGVLVVLAMIGWTIVRTIMRSPDITSRFFQRRRKDKGYAALSRGLIALGSGDAKLARKLGLDAERMLSGEPATQLLLAQTAQLSGSQDEARGRFERMMLNEETRLLGLHGLYIEATRHDEPVAARHYAEEAVKLSPGLAWAGKALLGYQATATDWEASLKTLESNFNAKLIDKKTYRRHKAALMTARASELEQGEPDRARVLSLEAHGLAPDLVPAAVVSGRLLTRRGDIRKAAKVLETTWKKIPHPDIAEAYAHVRTGDSARDRMKRVSSLAAIRPNHAEGALAIARVAIDGQEFAEARKSLKKVLRSEPTQRAFLMMAELEEAEHGDRGRVREWLSRAVHAPRDYTWIADGVERETWAPVSPVSGKLDAFEWRQPQTALSAPVQDIDESLIDALEPLPAPIQQTPVEKPPVETASTDDIEDKSTASSKEDPKAAIAEKPVMSAVDEQSESKTETAAPIEGEIITSKDSSEKPGESAPGPVAEASSSGSVGVDEKKTGSEETPANVVASVTEQTPVLDKSKVLGSQAAAAKPKPVDFPLKQAPDDPGPAVADEKIAKNGFGVQPIRPPQETAT